MIVPDADEDNYGNEMDRCMLYIACTRAMHELHLTHERALSGFLSFAADPELATVTRQQPAPSH